MKLELRELQRPSPRFRYLTFASHPFRQNASATASGDLQRFILRFGQTAYKHCKPKKLLAQGPDMEEAKKRLAAMTE